MKNITVRNNKISTDKRADRLRALGLISGAAVLVLLFFLVVVPTFISQSVNFSYGDR